MSGQPLRLIVLANEASPKVHDAWMELKSFLDGRAGTEIVAAELTEDLALDGLQADLVVVLGGDGAMLRACRKLNTRQLPILGVNLGRLGFLADLSPDEFRQSFETIEGKQFTVVEHLMFQCELRRTDGQVESFLGLNEAALTAGGSFRMIDIRLAIDGEPVTTYSGDGLIVSTPVGSTAHNLSAGGPILRQDLKAFVITPICPHTLTNRPVVDHADRVFTLTVPHVPDGALLVVDGQIRREIAQGDEIEVRRAPVTMKLAKIPGHSYYSTLHRKLGWGGQPKYQS